MSIHNRPTRSEAAEYYFTYIDKIGEGDIREILSAQLPDVMDFFQSVTEEQSLERNAPEQWTGRQVLNHINDGERLFVFRAVWFARGLDAPLPGFDQNIAVATAQPDQRSWASHVEEFRTIRESTLTFFNSLTKYDWSKRGIASDNPVTVNALAYNTAGHLEHHVRILRKRYSS